jgi:hypothetical protein
MSLELVDQAMEMALESNKAIQKIIEDAVKAVE